MRPLWMAGAVLAFAVGFGAAGMHAQQAPAAQKKAPGAGEIDLTAASANVAAPGTPVKIRILRWSTDEERTPLMTALTAPARPSGPAGAAAERAAGAGRGGGRAGGAARGAGGGAAPADAAAPARGGAAAAPAAGAANAQAGAAAGRAGRAGRGALVQRAPLTPVEALAQAIGKAPTVGYIWTNDVTGYSIKYAWHAPLNGGERIVLVTDRRLGMYSPAWKLASATPATDYDFTVIEIHVDARGLGEGKTSLTNKVTVDTAAKTLALDNYAGAPVLLQGIKHSTAKATE